MFLILKVLKTYLRVFEDKCQQSGSIQSWTAWRDINFGENSFYFGENSFNFGENSFNFNTFWKNLESSRILNAIFGNHRICYVMTLAMSIWRTHCVLAYTTVFHAFPRQIEQINNVTQLVDELKKGEIKETFKGSSKFRGKKGSEYVSLKLHIEC